MGGFQSATDEAIFPISSAKSTTYDDINGAAGGDRTHDPWLRRPILYPLSYSRNAVRCA